MTAVEWLFEQVVNRTERVYFLKELEQAKEQIAAPLVQNESAITGVKTEPVIVNN